jgi:hypothetical protein
VIPARQPVKPGTDPAVEAELDRLPTNSGFAGAIPSARRGMP